MTPDEIKQWMESAVRTEGPDAGGNMTYHAADGNYIVVRPGGTVAMRGFRPPAEGSQAQQQPPAQSVSAAPSTPPGSGVMDQAQLEALLRQIAPNGDPGRLEFNQGTRAKTVRSGGGIMGTETETIQVPYVQWIDRATGQTLEADIEPGGGSYTVTFNGKKEANQGAQATTPAQAQQSNVGTPTGNTRTRSDNGTTTKEVEYQLPDGTREWRTQTETAAPDRVGKPTGNTRTRSANGQTIKETEYQLPDGTTVWRSQTETVQPDQVGKPTGSTRQRTENGQTIKEVEYVLPDGTKEWRAQTAPTGEQTMPANMPPFQPDINRPALGLIEYAQRIYALAAQKKPDGTPYLTEQQKNEALTIAHQQAETEARRLDNIRASQAQQQANEINQRNADLSASVSRGSQAISATQDAFNAGVAFASKMTPKNYTPGLMQAILGLQDDRMQRWGGLERPARVTTQGYPMLQGLNQMGLPGQTPTYTDVANQTANTMAGSNAAFGAALGNPPTATPPPPATPEQDAALQGADLGPIGPANLFPTPHVATPHVETPQAMQVTHPVVSGVLGQAPPGADPQAWQQAVQMAAMQMGLTA